VHRGEYSAHNLEIHRAGEVHKPLQVQIAALSSLVLKTEIVYEAYRLEILLRRFVILEESAFRDYLADNPIIFLLIVLCNGKIKVLFVFLPFENRIIVRNLAEQFPLPGCQVIGIEYRYIVRDKRVVDREPVTVGAPPESYRFVRTAHIELLYDSILRIF